MPLYRTTDNDRWGIGLGRNLTATEGDRNIWDIAQAIVDLQSFRPQPDEIVSIVKSGAGLLITLQSGAQFGPIAIPALVFRWRSAWEPFTVYSALDTFPVVGVGIFSVLIAHTSGADFEPDLLSGGLPVYNKLFGTDIGTGDTVDDIGFFYQGILSESVSDTLFLLPLPRKIIVPSIGNHQAYLIEAPSTAAQVMPVYHNGTQVGHIDFVIGENAGTVTINADETIERTELLSVGTPALDDATAEGLGVVFAAQRVL
jgi:hypothetical protein